MSRYSKLFLALTFGFAATSGCSSRGEEDSPIGEHARLATLPLDQTGISATIAVYPGGETYRADVLVKNTGTKPTTNWEVDIQLNNSSATSGTVSNATLAQNGSVITLRPLATSNNAVLAIGQLAYPSFSGLWSSTPHLNPTVLSVRRDVGSYGSGGVASGGSSNKGGSTTRGGSGGTAAGGSVSRGGSGGTLTGGATSKAGSAGAVAGGAVGKGGSAAMGGAVIATGGAEGGGSNNIAQGKLANASSALAGNPASSANDASSATSWCASTSALNEWWTVDLGADFALTGTEVTWPNSGRAYQYAIGVSSDGIGFNEVVNQRSNFRTSQTQADSYSAQGRYIRLMVTGLPTSPATSACVANFRVFGSSIANSGGGGGAFSGNGGASSVGGNNGTANTGLGSATVGGATSSGTIGSGGATTGGATSGGATSASGTNVEFFFQLPKGVHRNGVVLATFGGDLYVNDNVQLKTKTGFAAASAVAGGKLARLGVSAQTGDVWSEGLVTLANNAKVNGDLLTASSVSISAGGEVVGHTYEKKDIGPLQTVKWTVNFPIVAHPALDLLNSTLFEPAALPGLSVKPGVTLSLSSGTYTMSSLMVDTGGTIFIDNSQGPVFIYIKNGFTFRGSISTVSPTQNVLFGIAGSSAIPIEKPFRGILVAPYGDVSLATVSTGHQGAFFARSITAHQQTTITLDALQASNFCAAGSPCSAFCPCGIGTAPCDTSDSCETGLTCDNQHTCVCQPDCSAKHCGDDSENGCGGRCTSFCSANELGCSADDQCQPGSKCFIGGGPRKGKAAGSNICLPKICEEQDPH